jgi:PST family polysaccharide transporter
VEISVTPPDDSAAREAGATKPSLAARVVKGAGWIVGGRFIMGLLGFLNTIIVARLLAPDDFGVVAIGVTAMQILINLSDIGVSQAVIRFRDADRSDLDTLFTLSTLRGAAIFLLLLACAPFAADFYGDERVFWVLAGVGLYPLFTGAVNPKFYEFERDLDYSKDFQVTVANKLAGVIVSIAIAFAFRSYWAIVLGLATNAVVQLFLSYAMRPYRPHISFASLRRVFAFSGWLTGVGFISALNNKLDALIIARAVSTVGAGHYFMGQQLAELPTRELAAPVARAVYPGLSELQSEPERAKFGFLRGVEALAAVAMPAAIGFALIARDVIPFLLGEKWHDAVPIVEIMTPVMGVQMPFLITQYYAMAVGSTRLVFIRELIFFLVRTPIFILATVHYGLIGSAWAVALCGVLHVALNLALYGRTSGDWALRPIWRARRSIAAALAMTALLLGLRVLGLAEQAPPVPRVLAEIVAGVGVYGLVHIALWKLEREPDGVERSFLDLAAPALGRLRARRNP